jgi:hypothetical protein
MTIKIQPLDILEYHFDGFNYINNPTISENRTFSKQHNPSKSKLIYDFTSKFDISKLSNLNILFGKSSIILNGDYTRKLKTKKIDDSIQKAKKAGSQAARLGYNMLSTEQLIRKNYSQEQIMAYMQAYKNAAGDFNEQMKRRICLAGYQAARYGCKRPSENKLKRKGYTQDQISIYYAAYDQTVGTEQEQLQRRIKRLAYQMARMKADRPTLHDLFKRGFDNHLIKLFYDEFDKTMKQTQQNE